jgi:hypothetical protein
MRIKETWKEHSLYKQGLIECIPTEWVYVYRGLDVDIYGDLKNGTLVNLEDLWQNILEEGLYDPIIIRVGIKTNTFRLEAGNHRIQLFHSYNVQQIPATVQITDECGPHAPNVFNTGTHNFDATGVLKYKTLKKGYVKPSDVFKDLPK